MELVFKQGDPELVDPLYGVPNKNSRRYKKIWLNNYHDIVYTWKLSRYIKPNEMSHMFSYYSMHEYIGGLHYADVSGT